VAPARFSLQENQNVRFNDFEPVSQPGIESLYLPIEDGAPLAHHWLRQGTAFEDGNGSRNRFLLLNIVRRLRTRTGVNFYA
jgi:hypothetical protein